jgi:hypothetical protein
MSMPHVTDSAGCAYEYVAVDDLAVSKRSSLLPLLAHSTGFEVTITTILIFGFHRLRYFPALFLPLKYLSSISFPPEEDIFSSYSRPVLYILHFRRLLPN